MSRFLHRAGITAGLLVVISYALNAFFYAGSAFGGIRWRLSQGRLRLSHSEMFRDRSPYVAIADGNFYFGIDWFWSSVSYWSVSVPLWMPLVLILLATWRARVRSKSPRPA